MNISIDFKVTFIRSLITRYQFQCSSPHIYSYGCRCWTNRRLSIFPSARTQISLALARFLLQAQTNAAMFAIFSHFFHWNFPLFTLCRLPEPKAAQGCRTGSNTRTQLPTLRIRNVKTIDGEFTPRCEHTFFPQRCCCRVSCCIREGLICGSLPLTHPHMGRFWRSDLMIMLLGKLASGKNNNLTRKINII